MEGLPNSLNLSPHLGAHKYIFVCTLTIAAWDTLVLWRRTWKNVMSPGIPWTPLKAITYFMRAFMPIEFAVVAIGYFDTTLTQSDCGKFFLFEPICTTILIAVASVVHLIRIHGIYGQNRTVLAILGPLFAVQVVVMTICCGFYRAVPLLDGQGCISGPKANWVGIYWVAPTVFYTASMILAINRSIQSLEVDRLHPWNLILRDSLNLYGVIWLVNMVNMLVWFIMKPTDAADPIKTILSGLAAVTTASNSLRIVVNIRGSHARGGELNLRLPTDTPKLSLNSHILSARQGLSDVHSTLTVDAIPGEGKGEPHWAAVKSRDMDSITELAREPDIGVKITIDREIGYDSFSK